MENESLNTHRFKQNPDEFLYAKAWEQLNTSFHGELDGKGVLDYLLADRSNEPSGEVAERDRAVAASVVQWLGSHVGKSFLANVTGQIELRRQQDEAIAYGKDLRNGRVETKPPFFTRVWKRGRKWG